MSRISIRWAEPGMLRKKRELARKRDLVAEGEPANPDCSLVPAAQAKAARSR